MPTIVLAANESYRRLAAALLASLVEHDRDQLHRLQVILLDTGFLNRTRILLKDWARDVGLRLQIITVSPGLFRELLGKDVIIPKDFPYYARLLGPHLVDVDRIAYLDADILVLSSIMDLFETNLEQKVVAACIEPNVRTFAHETAGIPNYCELGIPAETPYFNSGVLLVDVVLWRQVGISAKVLKINADNAPHVTSWDQYGLNIALQNQWLELPAAWNETVQVEQGVTHLRHFAWKKPVSNSHVPDADLFFRYLDKSPYAGWRPTHKGRIRRKIGDALIRTLRYFGL